MPPAPNEAPARRTPEQEFAARVSGTANKQLQHILGTDAGKRAAHTITMAMLSSMRTARDPSAFLKVTEASIADCVATSYETGLHPGGPNPTVYLVPQAPRKGEQPELQWRITHRGLAILAARAGYGILAVPVAATDKLKIEFGEVTVHEAAPDAWPEKLTDIVGGILVVRRISDGVVICRAWMPLRAILQRKNKSRDGSVWNEWPIEMTQKTLIKWGFARGYVPLDSPEMRSALEADDRGDVIDVRAESMGIVHEVPVAASARQKVLGTGAPAGTAPAFDTEPQRERERVPVDPGGQPSAEEMEAILREERAQAGGADDEGMS